jgi:hypothetical protein
MLLASALMNYPACMFRGQELGLMFSKAVQRKADAFEIVACSFLVRIL